MQHRSQRFIVYSHKYTQICTNNCLAALHLAPCTAYLPISQRCLIFWIWYGIQLIHWQAPWWIFDKHVLYPRNVWPNFWCLFALINAFKQFKVWNHWIFLTKVTGCFYISRHETTRCQGRFWDQLSAVCGTKIGYFFIRSHRITNCVHDDQNRYFKSKCGLFPTLTKCFVLLYSTRLEAQCCQKFILDVNKDKGATQRW